MSRTATAIASTTDGTPLLPEDGSSGSGAEGSFGPAAHDDDGDEEEGGYDDGEDDEGKEYVDATLTASLPGSSSEVLNGADSSHGSASDHDQPRSLWAVSRSLRPSASPLARLAAQPLFVEGKANLKALRAVCGGLTQRCQSLHATVMALRRECAKAEQRETDMFAVLRPLLRAVGVVPPRAPAGLLAALEEAEAALVSFTKCPVCGQDGSAAAPSTAAATTQTDETIAPPPAPTPSPANPQRSITVSQLSVKRVPRLSSQTGNTQQPVEREVQTEEDTQEAAAAAAAAAAEVEALQRAVQEGLQRESALQSDIDRLLADDRKWKTSQVKGCYPLPVGPLDPSFIPSALSFLLASAEYRKSNLNCCCNKFKAPKPT